MTKIPLLVSDAVDGYKVPPMPRPVGNPLIPYGSPLHTTELFLQLLKVVFASLSDDHPYKFINDDFEKSGVAFDVSLNKESEIYGKKPLIVVSRATQTFGIVAVGDLGHVNLHTDKKWGSNVTQCGVNVSVTSRVKAEVEVIAQMVFSTMVLCRTHFPKLLGIHMAEGASMSEVSKFEEDDSMFICQIGLQYQTQYKWTQLELHPILQAIDLNFTQQKN